MKKFYAGIDLGGTNIKCGIVSSDGEILIKDSIPTGKDRPYKEIALDMANLVKSLEKKSNISIEGVGIGSPGTIDSENGIIVYSNNIAWKNVPLGAELSKLLNLPVKITNDANAAALGEYTLIKDKYKSLVFITLGTGVGGGVIIDGKLFEGYKSAGAELGHSVIRINGEKCTCGRKGCLEAYASATAIIRQAKKAMSKDNNSILWKLCQNNLDRIDGKMIFNAWDLGDNTATKVVKQYCKYIAEGLTNFANIFRPEIILIGGGISAQGEKITKPIRRMVINRLFGGIKYAPIKIETAKLMNDAGLVGASQLLNN